VNRQLIFNSYQFIENAAGDAVDIFIDGDIVDEPTREMYQAFWGDECSVSFKSIRNQITASKAKTFNIYVNSGGGMVMDAFAIHDYIVDLENRGVTVNTVGMGIIASAATYILMAAKNSRITENSWFMIHNMSGAIYGDVNEIENYAKTMRNFNNAAVTLYTKATGKDTATVINWMNEETWFKGKEACDNGFVKDCSGKETGIKNAIPKEKWPFKNAAILNSINNGLPKNKGMKKNKIANAIKAAFEGLGLANDAKLSTVKVDELRNALTTSFEAVEDDEDTDAIVKNALTGDAFNAAVAKAVTNALATVPANITDAITTATAGLVKTADLDAVKNDLADKLGTPKVKNTKNSKPEADTDTEDYSEIEGITWNKR
jgi:ATP-dependent Clp protease protease subunit